MTQLFLEALSKENSVLIKTASIYNIRKADLIKITALKDILCSLTQKNRDEGSQCFLKQVEMLKELNSIDIIKLMIISALNLYTAKLS